MNKLSLDFQQQFNQKLIYDNSVFDKIDQSVTIHGEAKKHPLSSAAACLNVLGSLGTRPTELKNFLNSFGLAIEEIIEFPYGAEVGGLKYHDRGCVVFEWIGPKTSPLNERGGGRGHNRTSIDAYVLGKIDGQVTQILIEWKFTEGHSRPLVLGKFSGGKGVERLRRYSSVLAQLRNEKDFPFQFEEEYSGNAHSAIGLYDFSPDHMYQLLRMTLLAKTTTPISIGDIRVDDYRIVHLSHSDNDRINKLHKEYLFLSPGLMKFEGMLFHDVWKNLLSEAEQQRFFAGYWNKSLSLIGDASLRQYLEQRY